MGGAEHRSDREFSFPHRCSRQKQVCDIAAGYEQQYADSTEQQKQRWTKAPHDRIRITFQFGGGLFRIVSRRGRREPTENHVQVGGSLAWGDMRLEPAIEP